MPQKILLVEDDDSICTVVTATLESFGYHVDSCDNGETRNMLLNTNVYDAMITDVMLKDSDGISALADIKSQYPKMPYIIVSAQNSLDTAVRANEVEAFEYFPKPFDLDELVNAVNQCCKKEVAGLPLEENFDEQNIPIIGRSPAMQDVFRMVVRLLNNDLSVMVLGESGSGKELVAEAIHNLGHRKTGPFVAINMAAIPSELIESELFGHEKGSFTGAVAQSIGKFEQAQGGTLFLDEIGDMPMHAQTRLLRALQTGAINRVGGKANIKLDVRIVAATNQNLEELIEANKFREDLYYRLNVVPIALPPLRDRRDDIPRLVNHFLGQAPKEGLPIKSIDDKALKIMETLPWRGNVRELKNFIMRLVVTCRTDIISDEAVRALAENSVTTVQNVQNYTIEEAVEIYMAENWKQLTSQGDIYDALLNKFEKPLLKYVMLKSKNNQLKASATLGINRNTLRKKLQEIQFHSKN